jgi:hypothetical protein
MATPETGFNGYAAAMAAALMLAGCASNQNKLSRAEPANPPSTQSSKIAEAGKKAGTIATQPARDVGVVKTGIPPILAKAGDDPYSLEG